MTNEEAYAALKHWHYRTGSMAYYVDGLVRKAREEDAPEDAIYHNGRVWVTMRDLTPDHPFRASLAKVLA